MADEGTNPFVINLWRSFQDEDNLYLLMDFHPGGDLRTLLERQRILSRNQSRFYASEIVDGVACLHSAGIIHRNLKPEHILINKDGHIVICGFGKSKEFQRSPIQPATTGTTANALCGTAEYFAPEVIKGLPYTHEVDWWCLGIILYEMLMGIRPFDADNMSDMFVRILQDEVQLPEDHVMDQHTKDFIQGLLKRDPALRFGEPQIRCHSYFSIIFWSGVRNRQYKPPDIPPMDRSNLCDTQNFEEVYLKMEPVISDEIDVDRVEERAQTDAESIDDACEEDTLNGPPSIVIDDGEEDETSVETDTGGEGPTKQAFPDAQLLDSWSHTFPPQWRLSSP